VPKEAAHDESAAAAAVRVISAIALAARGAALKVAAIHTATWLSAETWLQGRRADVTG